MVFESLPTIFLVPGAVQTSACFDSLAPRLREAGFPVVAASLLSSNPSNPEDCTATKDGEHILEHYLLPLINDGKNVVIYAHSFGATCLSGAGQRLSKAQRAASGLLGGVLGVVYMSFCAVPDGQSQLQYGGNEWPPFVRRDYPSAGLFVFADVRGTLFNDVDADSAAELAKGHTPHSMTAIATPVHAPLWTDPGLEGFRTAIVTKLDATFPTELQDMFLANSGVEWQVEPIEAGHEAFLTQPGMVANIIINQTQIWCK